MSSDNDENYSEWSPVDASVKKTILPEFWSAAKGKALEKKREYKELNLYLDSIRLRIMKIQRELEIEV